MTTDDRGTTARGTVAMSINVTALSFEERRTLRDELFTTEMKDRIQRLSFATDELRSAVSACEDAASSITDREERDGTSQLDEVPREHLLGVLHAWHDTYHPGAFRLCREVLCADLGVSTSGPAPTIGTPLLAVAGAA